MTRSREVILDELAFAGCETDETRTSVLDAVVANHCTHNQRSLHTDFEADTPTLEVGEEADTQ